ncbi:MAG: hypothetical protein NVV63_08245 [Opitutus sp.]|nr:hypothetical protein [Opitutus sp.]
MNLARTSHDQPRWFCLRTQPRREEVAAANLRERVEVDVFAPRFSGTKVLRNGSVTRTSEALFPGYVFARFSHPAQTRHVVSTRGVVGLVTFAEQAPAIEDHVIDFLRQQVESRPAAQPVFEEGSWVRVVTGCFRSVEGRVLARCDGSDRIRILLSLLGREVQVSVPATHLAATHQPVGVPEGLLVSPARGAAV